MQVTEIFVWPKTIQNTMKIKYHSIIENNRIYKTQRKFYYSNEIFI